MPVIGQFHFSRHSLSTTFCRSGASHAMTTSQSEIHVNSHSDPLRAVARNRKLFHATTLAVKEVHLFEIVPGKKLRNYDY